MVNFENVYFMNVKNINQINITIRIELLNLIYVYKKVENIYIIIYFIYYFLCHIYNFIIIII